MKGELDSAVVLEDFAFSLGERNVTRSGHSGGPVGARDGHDPS